MMAQDVTFGLKGGVNFSNVSKEDFDGESRTSFHIGGVMEALYGDKIALQPEIIYSQQGFTYQENGIERSLKFSYINVPVMVKYYVVKGIAIEAGPQIGFRNTAKIITTVNGEQAKQNIKRGLRGNDLSLNLGMGFKMTNGLNFNARYCYGLTNISVLQTDEKFKNRVLQLSVGYLF